MSEDVKTRVERIKAGLSRGLLLQPKNPILLDAFWLAGLAEAAPDLLAACKAALSVYFSGGAKDEAILLYTDEEVEVMLTAAIAKAEGTGAPGEAK